MAITLATLPLTSALQVFNPVYTHLLAQNSKSEYVGAWVYRADDGLKCAAGCLISDERIRRVHRMEVR